MKVVLRVFGYMRRYWPQEVVAYACMLGINGVRVLWPQFVRRVFWGYTHSRDGGIERYLRRHGVSMPDPKRRRNA